MKKIFVLIIAIFIHVSSFSQWFSLNSGSTSAFLYNTKFFNENTGWVVGDNRILKTTNGGLNWTNLSPSSSFYLRAGFFINQNTGWAAGSSNLIIKTTNSGLNWLNYSAVPGTNWHQIYFANEMTGYIVGTSGAIVKSTNGGINWFTTPSGVSSYLFSVFFLSPDTGWATGYDGTILKTTSGGNSWIFQLSGLNSGLLEVLFLNYNTGWTVSDNGVILKTTNSGTTWVLNASLGTINALQSVDFINDLSGWVIGGNPAGSIFATTNGGVNWTQQLGGDSNTLIGIDMVNSSTGYIAGFNGTILKTINGGYVSVQKISEIVLDKYQLKQNYPNPFNPKTQIEYSVVKPSMVTLTVFDITGNVVNILVNEFQTYGTYRADFDGTNLSSGIYLYKLETENFAQTKKMIIIK